MFDKFIHEIFYIINDYRNLFITHNYDDICTVQYITIDSYNIFICIILKK